MNLTTDQLLGLFGVLLAFFYSMYNRRVKKLEDTIEEIKELTIEIRLETKTNHGSSLRDQTDRIEVSQEKISERLNGISIVLAKLQGKFEQHMEESD